MKTTLDTSLAWQDVEEQPVDRPVTLLPRQTVTASDEEFKPVQRDTGNAGVQHN